MFRFNWLKWNLAFLSSYTLPATRAAGVVHSCSFDFLALSETGVPALFHLCVCLCVQDEGAPGAVPAPLDVCGVLCGHLPVRGWLPAGEAGSEQDQHLRRRAAARRGAGGLLPRTAAIPQGRPPHHRRPQDWLRPVWPQQHGAPTLWEQAACAGRDGLIQAFPQPPVPFSCWPAYDHHAEDQGLHHWLLAHLCGCG